MPAEKVFNVCAAEISVKSRFAFARNLRHPEYPRFRVFLQWRHEPNLPWVRSKKLAWKMAETFLDEYPKSPYVNQNDAARKVA